MKVKICGLRKKADVEAAVKAGADYIGFVFASSKRQVTRKEAHDLAEKIPDQVKVVGVFVNPTLEEVSLAIKEVPLDVVQLHGQEKPEFIAQLKCPVIKAISISNKQDLLTIADFPSSVNFLIDTPGDMYVGGSGQLFDWYTLNPESLPRERLFIAGGLTSENVSQAIAYFAPYGVDVSSGVETEGQKDGNKIKEFIVKAKGEHQK